MIRRHKFLNANLFSFVVNICIYIIISESFYTVYFHQSVCFRYTHMHVLFHNIRKVYEFSLRSYISKHKKNQATKNVAKLPIKCLYNKSKNCRRGVIAVRAFKTANDYP